jgi:hypothetical protein
MRWFHWTVEEFEELKNPVNFKMVILLRNQLGKYELTSTIKRKQLDKTKQRPIKSCQIHNSPLKCCWPIVAIKYYN